MGKIIVSTNTSLDGVVQDPDGKEGWARGGWLEAAMGSDREVWAKSFFDEAMSTDALLLGRQSEQWFGSRWASRTGAWADRLNGLPKYVVSSGAPTWTNATVLGKDLVGAVTSLKREVHGEIAVYASYQLVNALMANDLVDEVRVIVFPVVVGTGRRLFGEESGKNPLRLASVRPLGEGLVSVAYASPRA